MRLAELLGTRLAEGDAALVAYEGPLAGKRTAIDLGGARRGIRRVEAALAACGNGRLRVGVLSNHQVETYLTVMAAVVWNHTFVPLNPKFPHGRLEQIIDLGAVDVVLHDSTVGDALAALTLTVPTIDVSALIVADPASDEDDAAAVWASSVPDRTVVPDDIAYVMFTSGSTGTPKGVPVSYGNLTSYVQGITDVLGIERGLRHTQFFDLSFDLSIHDIFVSNHLWGTLVAPTKVDLMMPSGYVSRERIDVWFSVPILGAQLGRATPNAAFGGVAHMLFCGEALPMETVVACRAWLREGGDIWNLYGPTEATIAFTGARVTSSERDGGNASIGHPFGANQVALLVDGVVHRDLADDLEGELLLGGPQVFAGYSTDAPSPFLDADGMRWYRSGDLVRIDHEGVYFRGRIDSQVKYRGYRIELGEIEAAVRRTFGLKTVAVVLQGEQGDARIACFHLAEEVAELGIEIDPSALEELLPSYMIPGSFVALDAMPINQNSKIDRKALVAWAT